MDEKNKRDVRRFWRRLGWQKILLLYERLGGFFCSVLLGVVFGEERSLRLASCSIFVDLVKRLPATDINSIICFAFIAIVKLQL